MSEQILKNQMVTLPNENEELRYVFNVSQATTPGLPSDATLEGYIYWNESGQSCTKVPMFYSESWRTWFPLPAVV